MTSIFTALTYCALTVAFACLLVQGEDRRWVSKVMLIAWLVLFPLAALVNTVIPFTGGGDDEDYIYIAAAPLDSIAGIFDLTRFAQYFEQPGYPWLLSIAYQFTGHDLLALKLANVALLIAVIPIWYRIAAALESREFGRSMSIAVILVTPLWYYGFFALKDMAIVFLQSAFLLGVVQASRTGGIGSWILCLLATVALIPFRSLLVLVNIAVLAGSIALTSLRRQRQGREFTAIASVTALAASVLIPVLLIASDFQLMAQLGISSERRVIGSFAVLETVDLVSESSEMNRALFPFLYLLTETAGLTAQTWNEFDGISLRSALALPWIFVGVPFFVLGLKWLMQSVAPTARRRGFRSRIQSIRAVATPWGSVLTFLLVYIAISWTSGDTTRWRIPDMPAMGAVALAGWLSTKSEMRVPILLSWIVFSGSAFAVFYLMQGL